MITSETLLNMSNKELCEWFRKDILESESDPDWKQRLEEYYNNIERDFQEEWSNKRFKWFFQKYRQKKLRSKIMRRYQGPLFWIIEDVIDELLPKTIDEHLQQFVDVKDFHLGEKNV